MKIEALEAENGHLERLCGDLAGVRGEASRPKRYT
jgi:hypothetical protein